MNCRKNNGRVYIGDGQFYISIHMLGNIAPQLKGIVFKTSGYNYYTDYKILDYKSEFEREVIYRKNLNFGSVSILFKVTFWRTYNSSGELVGSFVRELD